MNKEERKLARRERLRVKRSAHMAKLEAAGIVLVADDIQDDTPRMGVWCVDGKLVINRCSPEWK